MLKYLSLFLLLNLVGVGQSNAQSGPACAKIANSDQRLECYDLVFRKTTVSGNSVGNGKWNVREDVSKIDDTKNVFLTLVSEDKHSSRYGEPKNSYLVIACRENTTSMYVTFADEFMSDNAGGGVVTYRIDKDAAAKKSFSESNDNSALGLWNGQSAIPFIKKIMGSETLLLRAVPFNESAVTATFDTRGLEEAATSLREACNW
jgi:type VI secretion system protein VasI